MVDKRTILRWYYMKQINRLPIVKEKDSREFICRFNNNKVTKEFLESCKKVGKLFRNKDIK